MAEKTPEEAYQEALRRIEEAGREAAAVLNLGGLGLTELPPELFELTTLEDLTLNNNKLTELPPEIGRLTQLTELNLFRNQLTHLPRELYHLTGLTKLDLYANNITEIPGEIRNLAKLRIFLTGNNIPETRTRVSQEALRMESLVELVLGGTSIKEADLASIQLPNLEILNIRDLDLTYLPETIFSLKKLRILRAFSNNIASISSEIYRLNELRRLLLSKNDLTELPREIGQLTNLAELNLSRNNLAQLPPEIGKLTKLNRLDLRNNGLPIPPEILEKVDEPQTILNYYFATVLAAERRPLDEAKMVLVGEGNVGKTSIVNRLVHGTFSPKEKKTEGIEITPWGVETGVGDIRLHVWDFGGQEIMHATHQFFLTERTLYLLVLNVRQSEAQNRLEYWLKVVESFGGDSPVIIVGNKAEQQPLDLNEKQLRQKYANIRAFVSTSCEENTGFEELTGNIQREVARLDHVKTEMSLAWFKVKDRLEAAAKKQDFVSYETYLELCDAEGVDDETSQETLIGFLHDLGIVLNFRDERYSGLTETQILNPEWVTAGVYRIINDHALMSAGGMFDMAALRQILKKPRYPRDRQRRFIVEMMRKFELCFSFSSNGQEHFLVPDLLPKDEPPTGDWDDALALEYHYADVLPGSLISRFIVRMQRRIHKDVIWRTGVMLARGDNLALVRADLDDRVIRVAVRGRGNTRRDFLAIIREQIEAINQTIANLEVGEKVPIPGQPGVLVDYDYLLENEADGIDVIRPPGAKARISVKTVLNGYEGEQERLDRRLKYLGERLDEVDRKLDRPRRGSAPEEPDEMEIFVSYKWGGESEEMVDAICDAFEEKGYVITRDKSHMNYRDSIGDFMRRIGRGKYVIAVVSDEYMKSEYCMYEACKMFESQDFGKRVFPIVIADTDIYSIDGQTDYLLYWVDLLKKIREKLKLLSDDDLTIAVPLTNRLRDIEVTTRYINDFMAQIADMNVLKPEMHVESGFEQLIQAIEDRMKG